MKLNNYYFPGDLEVEIGKFVDYYNNDYHIDSLSLVRQKGIPMGNSYDLDGIERGEQPDLGAYQWVPTPIESKFFR